MSLGVGFLPLVFMKSMSHSIAIPAIWPQALPCHRASSGNPALLLALPGSSNSSSGYPTPEPPLWPPPVARHRVSDSPQLLSPSPGYLLLLQTSLVPSTAALWGLVDSGQFCSSAALWWYNSEWHEIVGARSPKSSSSWILIC